MRLFSVMFVFCLFGQAWAQPVSFSGTLTDNLTLNIPTDFSSVSDALVYLENKKIDNGYKVTIQIANGTYTNQQSLVMSHPNGDRIEIIGNTGDASQVRLEFATGQAGVVLEHGNGLKLLSGVTLVGLGESGVHGINAQNNASIGIDKVVINSFNHGVFVGSNATVTGATLTSSSNTASGLYVFNGATLSVTSVTSSNNTHHGAMSYNNSMVQIQGAVISGNGVNGLASSRFGRIDALNATVSNNWRGAYCANSAAISAKGATFSGNTIVESPTFNTVGNGNSLIDTIH